MSSKSPTSKYAQVLKAFVPNAKNSNMTQKNKLNIVRSGTNGASDHDNKKPRRKPPSQIFTSFKKDNSDGLNQQNTMQMMFPSS